MLISPQHKALQRRKNRDRLSERDMTMRMAPWGVRYTTHSSSLSRSVANYTQNAPRSSEKKKWKKKKEWWNDTLSQRREPKMRWRNPLRDGCRDREE